MTQAKTKTKTIQCEQEAVNLSVKTIQCEQEAVNLSVKTNPLFVNRYFVVRETIEALEKERRELEPEVTDWGLIQLVNNESSGQCIAEYESAIDTKELLVVIRKPTIKDLKDKRLLVLAEEIEYESNLASEANRNEINQMMALQQEVKDKIMLLRSNQTTRDLQGKYDELAKVLLSTSVGKLGLMLKRKTN